ncbi:MAG TPA: glycosyltransferase, partial [Acidimicrobiales bacterium]|nr:glycosyltransferase [Acidimicrobiales bacterium]
MRQPTVSVVVPCKASGATIRETVHSLLNQDYPGLTEVILVGDVNDSTWQALDDIDDPRLKMLSHVPSGGRDPNVKRDIGLRATESDYLALADSDIVMPKDWLSLGISLMEDSGAECVAGGMNRIRDDFWGRYVDGTRIGAKTPRLERSYVVNARNFGRRGTKPPVTANVIFTRRLYERCPVDPRWMFGYEDYEWFWRVTRAGYEILFSPDLSGLHHHRRTFLALMTEYRRSSLGCAAFMRRHPDCPLAVKRKRQLFGLPIAGVTAVAASAVLAFYGLVWLVLAAVALGAAGSILYEWKKSKSIECLAYPFVSIVLGVAFLVGLMRGVAATRQSLAASPEMVAPAAQPNPTLAVE